MYSKSDAVISFARITAAAILIAGAAWAQGTPIGFSERFALADDRQAALEQLIPGTADDYYYRCLHLQNSGEYDHVGDLLQRWVERYGRTSRVVEIENRQALLTFDRDPAATFAFLAKRLGLTFQHHREVSGEKVDLPTALDAGRISSAALMRRAFKLHPGSLDGFADSALPFLASSKLDDDQLMSLLGRLRRPDIANLPALVVRNLRHPRSSGFGSLAIHRNLLLEQLEECVTLQPELLDQVAFVETYVRRLRPNADVDWQRDAAARRAYLERLEAFARRLSPAHNSFKAHVLYNRLTDDRSRGTFDRAKFDAYLRLPRPGNYVNPDHLRRFGRSNEVVDRDRDFDTGLPRVGDDESLVRAYLSHFLATADSYQSFAEYVRDDYLRRLFAEIKILAGVGDMERWYSLLDDPSYYERLKDRVDIEFAPTQEHYLSAGDPVVIDVDVKNVETLIVKVFEVDTYNFYREKGVPVDASINIDGLVANHEKTYTFSDGPLRRVRRQFTLAGLDRPGVYIVELIGNGISSRAVIQKGRLQFTQRLGAAGHVFRVIDEAGEPVPGAIIWFGGREYSPDEQGEIVIPYSTSPGRQTLVLRSGQLSTLAQFNHRGEDYQLTAGIHVDRESLLSRKTATVLVRPTLLLNDRAISLQALEEPMLAITAHDQDGVVANLDVRGLELHGDREIAHEIKVPDRLASLTVQLRGKVRSLTLGKSVDIGCAARSFFVNAIDSTAATGCPLLGRTAEGYVVDVLGKNGEPKTGRAIRFWLQHRDFKDAVEVSCKTDERGRIVLGELPGITRLRASGFPSAVGSWQLRPFARSYPRRVQGIAGEVLRVPYQGLAQSAVRSSVSLLELRDGAYTRDAFSSLAIANGFVELRDLPPGDYDLWLKEANRHIEVSITAGVRRSGWAIGRDRMLESDGRTALQLGEVTVAGGDLQIRLVSAGPRARVHVVATRYLPAFDLQDDLRRWALPDPWQTSVEAPRSSYHSGREIGDEYRYILERRFAAKYPGNMLRRPGLLLNPWALAEWNTAIGLGGGAGGAFRGRHGGRGVESPSGAPSSNEGAAAAPGVFPNLDFLPGASNLLTNLRADEEGIVRVPLANLGDGQLVHVIAVDDRSTVYASHTLQEKPLVPAEQTLASSLDVDRAFAEQRQIEFVDAGGTARLEDAGTAHAEIYDSLADVYQLFVAISGNPDLQQFAFLLGWPDLTLEEKRDLYGRHACHELNFFLSQKDPAFFAAVVQPYLANKSYKTFLDDWLLGADLTGYLAPRPFSQLNIAERILLARRLDGQAESIRRFVREVVETLTIDVAKRDQLFASVLKSGALNGFGALDEKLPNLRANRPAFKVAPKAPDEDRSAVEEQEEALPEEHAKALQDGIVARDRAVESKDKELAADDFARRKKARVLYRAPSATYRYVEHNYWHRPIEEQDASLVRANAFWNDYAQAPAGKPFVSTNIAEATDSFAAMMLALAVTDLPFAAAEHSTEIEGGQLTLRAASPLLLVAKEIVETRQASEEVPILVSQNFFRLDDPYRYEGNERRDAYVRGEFLMDVAYGCRVVVTNPTSSPRKLDVLLQIPQGAIPVQGTVPTRGVSLHLNAFATSSLEFAFYFPSAGRFPVYPVHVARDGELVASAPAVTMRVVPVPSEVDTTSWLHVSQNGSSEDVLRYLDSANLVRTDLDKLAWRMRDKPFFDAIIARLRRRHVYNDVLWSYGIHHGEVSVAREYLEQENGFVKHCGAALSSPLLDIDPVERRAYQHVEYEPLFNPRAHRFGKRREILNGDFAGQYSRLMAILAYRPVLDDLDWLSVTYYLLLQDRVGEAIATFAKVSPDRLPGRLQYDYMAAYLDFFNEQPSLARSIAERYRDYPVERWRTRFTEVLQQLDQAEGAALTGDPGNRAANQAALAAAAPSLELAVEANRVRLGYRNVDRCQVSYYDMDVEFLFSTQPFVQRESGSFAYIRPNHSESKVLPAEEGEIVFDLPAELHNSNVLVEVRGGGVTQRQAYYANSLTVHVSEGYGQLEVTDAETGRPLPKVYAKVFAKLPGGQVRFHKDGYTDLRGRFDYASVSGSGAQGAARYAVLVLSEDHGAVIREVAAPAQ